MATAPAAPSASAPRPRRGYLDWMRGLAVLIMIEAHVIDSWTAAADRATEGFRWSLILGGLGAPLFLFLAGVSVALSAGSKFRRTGDAWNAARAVARRGLEILALAFLFRVQAWVLGQSSPRTLLRVDILNIMGPSIAAAAVLWAIPRGRRPRFVVFALSALAMTLLTPIVRAAPILAVIPDPLEAYIRPVPGITAFVFFPWAGFVFAGALLGAAIDASRTGDSERRLNIHFAWMGAATALAAYGASFLPSLYAHSEFWTSSPSYFLLRTGVMTLLVALAYAWSSSREPHRWSPMQQLGRTSLFIYWIHVEMVYGLVSRSLHHALPLGTAWLAFGAFTVFLLGCSVTKDRTVGWWGGRSPGGRVPAAREPSSSGA